MDSQNQAYFPDKILNLIFPRECVGCGKAGSYLCFDCKKSLYAHPEICPFCHINSTNFQTCSSCKKEGNQALDGAIIGFAYQSLLKKLIIKLKFGHKKDVVEFLSARLALILQTIPGFLDDREVMISFIPSHRRRKYLEKGYNQSELLAKELATQLNFTIIPVAKKVKYTTSQLRLSRSERQKNLNSAFILLHTSQIPQRARVILVDDVLTTGSTLSSLAKLIKQSRPDLSIWGAVIARNMK